MLIVTFTDNSGDPIAINKQLFKSLTFIEVVIDEESNNKFTRLTFEMQKNDISITLSNSFEEVVKKIEELSNL